MPSSPVLWVLDACGAQIHKGKTTHVHKIKLINLFKILRKRILFDKWRGDVREGGSM